MWFFDPVALVAEGAGVEEEDENVSCDGAVLGEVRFAAAPEAEIAAAAFRVCFCGGDCEDGAVEEKFCVVSAVVGVEEGLEFGGLLGPRECVFDVAPVFVELAEGASWKVDRYFSVPECRCQWY